MDKSFNNSGFVIFSNDTNYELKILTKYFSSDSVPENIAFVYSKKNDISKFYANKLLLFKKNLLCIPFEEYNKIDYASAVESLDLDKTVMIIKDLRFMLKRLDERLSMMQIKHQCYKKIVLDTVPFMVDMWKFYFPYSFFDKTLLGYSHSYAFEAALRNYEDNNTLPDPYNPVELAKKVYGVTFVNYKKVFPFQITFKEYKVTESEQEGYNELKEKLFNTETSIKKIISKLYKYASSVECKGYNVPLKLNEIYDWSSDIIIHRTNLKVDDYLCSELMKLINNSNILAENLYGD